MEFRELFEFVIFEHVLEGIGMLTGAALIWYVFFGGGIQAFLSLLLSTT